jgi:alpha-galactosidase
MTDDEYRTNTSLWTLKVAALMTGNDARSMTQGTNALLMNKEVDPVNQDARGNRLHR